MSTDPCIKDKRLLELLERWQTGDFTRADEQELSALSNSDDFRREAVEGFWALPEEDHAAHLAALRRRLQNRTGRRVPLPQMWAAIAAAGLLILAVIWLLPEVEKDAPTAQKEVAKPTEDSSVASNLPEINGTESSDLGTSTDKLDPKAKFGKNQASDRRFESGTAASEASTEVASAPAPIPEKPALDALSATQPAESDAVYSKKMEAQTDDAASKPGNAAARTEDKKLRAAPAKAKEALQKPALAKESQPAGGWSEFQEYLRRNARLPETARQNNISGSVRLKFRLDEQNQPQDFQTLKPLGYGCEAEAIKLIQAFNWQRGINPEVIVDIPFVR
jgi:hypothetical protein